MYVGQQAVSWPELQQWRTLAESTAQLQTIELRGGALRAQEKQALLSALARDASCVYALADAVTEAYLLQLAGALGLRTLDTTVTATSGQLTTIGVNQRGDKASYVPYSERALGWHTDGYYNAATAAVRSFLLHCVCPAASGGLNQFVDPRRVLARIAAEEPQLLDVLAQKDCLTIPANVRAGREVRAAITTAVFARSSEGQLMTRYTERSRHVNWSHAAESSGAVTTMRSAIRAEARALPSIKLEANCGVLSMNALHCRTAFSDAHAAPRTILRGRFAEAIAIATPMTTTLTTL